MQALTSYPRMLHGCDYNPEQWLNRPDILAQDIEYMKKAHINCVSIGIFAWAALEPREGEYQLDWLAEIIDKLYQNGIYSVLVWEGACKGETTSQNSMLSVSDRMTITIYINENNVEVDNRDIAFFQTNCEGQEIKLQILEVKHYEHNTIIRAMHLKDGDNKK